MKGKNRKAKIERKTQETNIALSLDLDNRDIEKNKIDTGIGFLDHMLTLFAAHGLFRLDIKATGDIQVDYHHLTEDIGIALGLAFKEALGDMKGINRYGDIVLPMDETLIQCAVDISGRSYLNFDVEFLTEKIGDFDTELVKEFFTAFVRKSEVTLHIIELYGENSHHIAEGIFKASGRVLAKATAEDQRLEGKVPSTKGVLV